MVDVNELASRTNRELFKSSIFDSASFAIGFIVACAQGFSTNFDVSTCRHIVSLTLTFQCSNYFSDVHFKREHYN